MWTGRVFIPQDSICCHVRCTFAVMLWIWWYLDDKVIFTHSLSLLSTTHSCYFSKRVTMRCVRWNGAGLEAGRLEQQGNATVKIIRVCSLMSTSPALSNPITKLPQPTSWVLSAHTAVPPALFQHTQLSFKASWRKSLGFCAVPENILAWFSLLEMLRRCRRELNLYTSTQCHLVCHCKSIHEVKLRYVRVSPSICLTPTGSTDKTSTSAAVILK